MSFNTFYTVVLSAAATLMGLLFFAVLFNADRRGHRLGHRWLSVARSTLNIYVVLLLLPLVLLFPDFDERLRAAIILTVIGFSIVRQFVFWRPTWRTGSGAQLHTAPHLVWLFLGPVSAFVLIVPLFAAEILDDEVIERLPAFKKRMNWFLRNRPEIASSVKHNGGGSRLLATSRDQLLRILRYVLDEQEFLSPFGIRALSKFHQDQPFVARTRWGEFRVNYDPGESTISLFGGNSNWRGPIWFPLNYLLIEALECYHHFYGNDLSVEFPARSGQMKNLAEVAEELARRLTRLFLRTGDGCPPCHGSEHRFTSDPHWRDLVLFHEYFHAETGRGCGASHQTGWTALVTRLFHKLSSKRYRAIAARGGSR